MKSEGRSFYYGPNGEAHIFNDGEDVPRGWKDHPFADLSAPDDASPSASEEALVEAAKAFDHDGNGAPGGSLPKKRGRPPKAA